MTFFTKSHLSKPVLNAHCSCLLVDTKTTSYYSTIPTLTQPNPPPWFKTHLLCLHYLSLLCFWSILDHTVDLFGIKHNQKTTQKRRRNPRKEEGEKKVEMQIQVKCSCGEEKCPEWAIVELQGVVEVQPSFQGTVQNLEIGQLCRPSSQVGISSPKLAVIFRNCFIFCYWSLQRMDFLS